MHFSATPDSYGRIDAAQIMGLCMLVYALKCWQIGFQ